MEPNYSSELQWETLYQRDGITVKSWGEGENVVLFPGLEGNGTSCLYLTVPALREAAQQRPHRLLLVDYSQEEASTLDELIDAVGTAVRAATRGAPYLSWAQSFGNLLATGVLRRHAAPITSMIMVSPFTGMPRVMVQLSLLSLRVTPTAVYRSTIPLLGRYVFGPTGTPAGNYFFQALAAPTVRKVRKQTAWLLNRDFSEDFERISVPAKVWLGKRDRLVNLKEQTTFFSALADRKPNYHLSLIEGSGHVVLPQTAIAQLGREVTVWINSQQGTIVRSSPLL